MRYTCNHDLHIHSVLSSCCSDKMQTTEAHLEYARKNGLDVICITDHFWDSEHIPGASKWYQPQNYKHIRESLPLPEAENIKYLFGCETDMDKFMTLGISDKVIDVLDFIIVPTTHLHMDNFTIDEKDFSVERRADVYVKRFEHLLSLDLPFHKIGIAHLTCPLIAPARNGNPSLYKEVLSLISDDTFRELFTVAAKKGVGIELNFSAESMDSETLEQNVRPFRIAKECGCKFYLGSDSHSAEGFKNIKKRFGIIISALELTEDYKFDLARY